MHDSIFCRRFVDPEELLGVGFANLGKNVQIQENVNIYGITNVSVVDNSRIDGFTNIIATGNVSIGSYVHIGSFCHLVGNAGLEIEDFAGLSQGVKIYTVSDDYSGEALTNPTVPADFLKVKRGRVTLGRHVIVGAGTIIMPGVTIGEGSAVGALSFVNRDVPPWEVHVGVPARRVRNRKTNLLTLEKELVRRSAPTAVGALV